MLQRRLRILFTLVPILSTPLTQAAEGKLDLRGAIEKALHQSPVLEQARLARVTQELRARNARTAWFPSLDLTTKQGVTGSASTFSRVNTTSLGLTETLYDNHEAITTARVATLRSEIAQNDYDLAREQLTLDVTSEYLRFSLQNRLLEVRREQNLMLRKQFDLLSLQYRQGLRTREDFLRIKSQQMRSELDLLGLETQIAQSRTTLLRLVGESPSTSELQFDPIRPSVGERPSIPAAAPSLEGNYPVFRSFSARRAILEASETQAHRQFWPNLSVTGSVSYDSSVGASDAINSTASLGLSWNLLDWGVRSRNIEVASRALELELAKIQQDTLEARNAVEKVSLDLKRIQAQFELNSELVQNEEASYAALEENYRRGRISFLDVITGLRDLADARVLWFNTYFQLRQTIAQHRFYEGRLYAELNTSHP